MIFANLFGFGNPWDVAIIAGVVVLLFGGSKLPTFMRSLGDGMKEFKKAQHEMTAEPDEPMAAPMAVVEPARIAQTAPNAVVAPAVGASGIGDTAPHTAEAATATSPAAKE